MKYTLTAKVDGDKLLWTVEYLGANVIVDGASVFSVTAAIKAHVPGALFTDSNTFEGPVEHDGVISALRYVKCGYIITGPDGSEVKTGYPVKHLSWTSDTKLGPFKGDIEFRMGLVQPKKASRSC